MTRDSGLTSALCGRRVALLVTGSIAAYKAVVLMRLLMKEGARVRVAMTKEASRFVGEAAFSAFLNEPVLTDMWSRAGEPHIELGEWAEVMVVAPATATTIAKMASGVGDNVVVASFLAASGVVFVAPAMHHRMWLHPATQRNVRRLKSWGIHVIEPVEGELANGQRGIGRMAEPEAIVARLVSHFRGQKKDLAGCRVLVSAGPTEEPIDPVRVLTNRSSGKMGWVLAERARERGAEVILVAGPVALRPPEGVRCIQVRSALEMENAIRAHWQSVDAVVMAAAVSDWRPSQVHSSKIKRGDRECLVLELVPNPDILAGLG
ncbi:MAG: bifunctional phosphopantothenoylcysteine decarboxylase/phosphopantothenate--cysteine ligase CoaBC, partial [Deltaproteobacteria bacterium]|nr:bifunctional phosphopantothenoylcysteine decarboxylase/phosphopantothenate--cysteine ligase CoaBC [Deltaproteobacteria bacterium]